MRSNANNIVLTQIISDESSFKFKEVIPKYAFNKKEQALTLDSKGNICWKPIDCSINLLANNKLLDTNIYYDVGRIGVGRMPLFNYKFDIAVPRNTVMTAFHIGDGSFGFSMGNGTTTGFISEIIGIGCNENDTGLYFVGVAGNDKQSNVPLLIFDGRNTFNEKLTNRPIMGITSANYSEYVVLVDAENNMSVKGNVMANDILLKNNISLTKIIKELQEQIDELKSKIT